MLLITSSLGTSQPTSKAKVNRYLYTWFLLNRSYFLLLDLPATVSLKALTSLIVLSLVLSIYEEIGFYGVSIAEYSIID